MRRLLIVLLRDEPERDNPLPTDASQRLFCCVVTFDKLHNRLMEDLLAHIRADAKDLRHKFQEASGQGRGTSQEISDFRENALQSFLQNYFPFPYRIAKGGILDSRGNKSDSIDCILVNPFHPYTIDTRDKFKIILADGVDAAIEVKPDISRKAELIRGLKQGPTVKALRRTRTPLLKISNPSEEMVEYSLRTPYVIFTTKAKRNILETAEEVTDFYSNEGISPLDQADAIVVEGVGIIANYPVKGLFTWQRKDTSETASKIFERETGWFFEEWGADALAGFLLKLNSAFPARGTLHAPLISEYLRPTQITDIVPLPATPDAKTFYRQQASSQRVSSN
jgi:hypothetical protein